MKRQLTTLILMLGWVATGFGQVTGQPGQITPTNAQTGTTTAYSAGAVSNTSGLNIAVTAGPYFCGGALDYLQSTNFSNLTASTTYYLAAACSGQTRLILKTVPALTNEVPIATIVCGATLCNTITDNRPTTSFPLVTDSFVFVPAVGACAGTVSGNSTGTNGITSSGGVAVVQDQTSASGTNTHNYFCHVPLPSKTTAGKGVTGILDITFFYGVQTTGLGTQVATLASGTLNSVAVFQSTTFPAAGTSETQSAAYARADSGTAVWTPAVANFNVGTTTAGQFFTEKFAPATPLAWNTDLTDLTLNVALLNTTTSATVTQTPGFMVHYVSFPL